MIDANLIRNLLASGDLNLAIQQLREQSASTSYQEAGVQLSARYATLIKGQIAGTLSDDFITQTKNQLSQAVLELVQLIEDGKPPPVVDQPGEAITVRGKNILMADEIKDISGDIRIGDNHK